MRKRKRKIKACSWGSSVSPSRTNAVTVLFLIADCWVLLSLHMTLRHFIMDSFKSEIYHSHLLLIYCYFKNICNSNILSVKDYFWLQWVCYILEARTSFGFSRILFDVLAWHFAPYESIKICQTIWIHCAHSADTWSLCSSSMMKEIFFSVMHTHPLNISKLYHTCM